MKHSKNGFSSLELIIGLVIIGMVCFAGFRMRNEESQPAQSSGAEPALAETSVEQKDSKPVVSATKNLRAGSSAITISQEIAGQTVERTIHLSAPDNLADDAGLPLVFAFHGAGGSGNGFLRETTLQNAISESRFVGCTPTGTTTTQQQGDIFGI